MLWGDIGQPLRDLDWERNPSKTISVQSGATKMMANERAAAPAPTRRWEGGARGRGGGGGLGGGDGGGPKAAVLDLAGRGEAREEPGLLVAGGGGEQARGSVSREANRTTKSACVSARG